MSSKKVVKIGVALVACAVAFGPVAPAYSWGAPGHEYVGTIADQLIISTPGLSDKVAAILGPGIADLKTAAPWADCVRSVVKQGSSFVYSPDPKHPEYTAHCHAFESPDEIARMEDYASRNWDNCVYAPGRPCHEGYHFADIAVQSDGYDPSAVGANDHDVVHAINACIMVLEGQPAPAPFSIKDKKEALLLLAHFVGDETQPLHVAAVYLDQTGSAEDPNKTGHDPATDTRGGNSIKDGSRNLHSEWDDIDPNLASKLKIDVAAAQAVPAQTGAIDTWAAAWASETVQAGHGAFAGVSFGSKSGQNWPLQISDPSQYSANRAAIQEAQLVRGGAHLAQLVKALL